MIHPKLGQQLSEDEISDQIRAAAEQVAIGAIYLHYKQKTYKVLGLGTFEATGEPCVIYMALYGQNLTFIRPVSAWLEEVEWQGKTVKRFTKT